MQRPWLIVVGISAVSAGVLAFYLTRPSDSAPARSDATTESSTPPSTASTSTGTPPTSPTSPTPSRTAQTPTPQPSLPPVDQGPARTAGEVFDAQTRDDEWAQPTEAKLHERLQNVRGGKLESVECRQSQCRLTLTGSMKDIKQSIADLESNRGLHGFAKQVMLTAPEKNGDTITQRAYALFDR